MTAELLRIRFSRCPRRWHDDILNMVVALEGFSGANQGSDESYEILATSDDQSLQSFEKDSEELILYFENKESASAALNLLKTQDLPLEITSEEIENQDWNARWKKEFEGIDLPPYWRIIPPIISPWKLSDKANSNDGLKTIVINPAMGFGTGTHATTQLCLETIGNFKNCKNKNILDFGAGSGILATAAALKGANVSAVEIDEQACESARETFEINGVQKNIKLFQSLDQLQQKSFDIIIANIISSVLEAFAKELIDLSAVDTTIVLSGILEEQVPSVMKTYEDLFFKKHGVKRNGVATQLQEWWRIVV